MSTRTGDLAAHRLELHWEARCAALIEEHVRRDPVAASPRRLLNDWALERDSFWQVVPKEMLARLPQPLSDRVEEVRAQSPC